MGERTPSTLAPRLPLRTLWLGAGWLGVAIVIYYTLAPDPPQIDIEDGDKLQHLAAYAGLMLWFAQVRTGLAQRRVTALLLLAMGIALELAQGLTDYRTMSIADAAADAVGIALGWLAAPPRSPNVFAWVAARMRPMRFRPSDRPPD
jgi:VanZ family protein